jgi:predicted phage terminase large subunit-like protein
LHFTNLTFPGYRAEAAHKLIASHLDRVVSGEVKRLMIFAPPQHGKSELVSVRFPACWLGRRPDDPVILASYGASLAEAKSRGARQIVESDEYGLIFPGLTTRSDSRAVDRWELADPHRGSLLAVGVGGPILGHGARLGLIDDPFENWEQVQSQVMRDKVWDWWRTTFRTRIWEGGAIVLVMTRWHEDDLAGRLLAEQANRWTVLRLPAIAETQEGRDANDRYLHLATGKPDPIGRKEGEALCPLRFSRSTLEEIRTDVGSIAWGAEYQGVPRAPEGNRFKRHWFDKIVPAAPIKARRVRYWDKAATEDGGARSAGVLMAMAEDKTVYIENALYGHWSAGHRDQVMRQAAEVDARRYRNSVQIWTEQEPGSGGKESAQNSARLLTGFPVHADKVTGDKDVRMEPFAAQAEAGNVMLVRGAWNGDWLEEICSLPNGRLRDLADATAGAYNKLARDRRMKGSDTDFYEQGQGKVAPPPARTNDEVERLLEAYEQE